MTDNLVARLRDMGAALCRGDDVEAGEFLCAAAAEIERLQREQTEAYAAANHNAELLAKVRQENERLRE
jgi:hypothetical protein